jgi:choline dehydrogenase
MLYPFRSVSFATALALVSACAEPEPSEPVAAAAAAVTTPALPAYDATGCLGPGCEGGLVDDEFEFVIVGAGAGGGPLAARLAQKGHRVLLLEAGNDPGDKLTYQIPAWHALASEDPSMRWDYFVDHYDDPTQAARDEKRTPAGVWYPRGSGVGGSTSLNAMIAIAPHGSDWDAIADASGDASWRAPEMRKYFERAEQNGYMPVGSPGHGYSGWMTLSTALDNLVEYVMAATDWKMLRVIAAAVLQTGSELGQTHGFDPIGDVARLVAYVGSDMNASDAARDGREGVFRIPQQTQDGKRHGVRELVLDTIAAGYPLTLKTRALVTNVTFDRSGARPRATGVEWEDGANLYAASPRSSVATPGTARSLRVTGEVILSAGTFNTPQLLMLSGVGPRAALERQGIEVVDDLPGVGKNLQDRYEVGVIGEMSSMILGDQFRLLKSCSFDPSATRAVLDASDPCYVLWKHGVGIYTINGSVIGMVKRSRPELKDPDLFIFGIPGYFKGYYPGYSAEVEQKRTYFTWVVLKAHTSNTLGTVTLRSPDPRERPEIDFRYFGNGSGADGDLAALVEGVAFARRIVAKTKALSPPLVDDFREVFPGPQVSSRADLTQFIKDKAWGHHACCTAKIGADADPDAVLDGRFRVRGVDGLRVVDASAFPKIPGFFIAVPIYMMAEKAADVIGADALARPAL